jgi:hypothetical protein
MCLAWHKYYLMCNYSVALYIYIYFKVFQLEDLTCYLIPILLDIYIMSREKKNKKQIHLRLFVKGGVLHLIKKLIVQSGIDVFVELVMQIQDPLGC